jgi:hypothetical protein
MAPGITGGGTGRPRPAPLIRHWSCLVAKSEAPVSMQVGQDQVVTFACTDTANTPLDAVPVSHSLTTSLSVPSRSTDASPAEPSSLHKDYGTYADGVVVPLIALCTARSGDKGDNTNIGVIARNASDYAFIKQVLTASVCVASECKACCIESEQPNARALIDPSLSLSLSF